MPRNIEQEIADWRQELRDLEEALARQDQPLAPRTKAIAEAKVVTLRGQLAGIEEGDGRRFRPVKMKRKCFRALAGKISSHLAKKQAPIDLTGASPIAGWRCDLCAEVVVTHDRPLVPPERCPRCNSSNMTSMEEWGARRPPLGLWTR
jgi:rubrerythrin